MCQDLNLFLLRTPKNSGPEPKARAPKLAYPLIPNMWGPFQGGPSVTWAPPATRAALTCSRVAEWGKVTAKYSQPLRGLSSFTLAVRLASSNALTTPAVAVSARQLQ